MFEGMTDRYQRGSKLSNDNNHESITKEANETTKTQDTLSLARGKMYASLARAILGKEWTEPVAYLAFILEDIQLVTFLADPSMSLVYPIPQWLQNATDTTQRYMNGTIQQQNIVVSFIFAFSLLYSLICLSIVRLKPGSRIYSVLVFWYRTGVYIIPSQLM